jgi:hypothetical protein
MTGYSASDLDGWEFKIVRSSMGRFSNRAVVERLREEEARAGWEMVEKFDDMRIRFKRRVERRAQDAHLDFDPYRTTMSSGGSTGLLIGLGIALVVLGGALWIFLAAR